MTKSDKVRMKVTITGYYDADLANYPEPTVESVIAVDSETEDIDMLNGLEDCEMRLDVSRDY